MHRPVFGTPVNAGFVALRTGTTTPLVVLPFDDPARAQMVIAPPASWPALTGAEVAALRPYFDWDEAESFWWRTQYPALVSLERLGEEVWVGRHLVRGRVVPAGDDPRLRPTEGDYIFGMLRELSGASIRDPWGPDIARDAERRVVEIYRTESVRVVSASFPAFGPERVWLRLFTPSGTRAANVEALAAELGALRVLGALDPGCVVEVLHDGTLDVASHVGRYVALRPPVGVPIDSLFAAAGTSHIPPLATLCREVAASVARTVALAHSADPPLCVGPLSPALLRVRPALIGGRTGVRTVFVSLPAAGAAGGTVPSQVIGCFPEGNATFLTEQLRPHHHRSAAADLRSLGYFTRELGGLAGRRATGIDRVAQRLIDGEVGSAREAIVELETSPDD